MTPTPTAAPTCSTSSRRCSAPQASTPTRVLRHALDQRALDARLPGRDRRPRHAARLRRPHPRARRAASTAPAPRPRRSGTATWTAPCAPASAPPRRSSQPKGSDRLGPLGGAVEGGVAAGEVGRVRLRGVGRHARRCARWRAASPSSSGAPPVPSGPSPLPEVRGSWFQRYACTKSRAIPARSPGVESLWTSSRTRVSGRAAGPRLGAGAAHGRGRAGGRRAGARPVPRACSSRRCARSGTAGRWARSTSPRSTTRRRSPTRSSTG